MTSAKELARYSWFCHGTKGIPSDPLAFKVLMFLNIVEMGSTDIGLDVRIEFPALGGGGAESEGWLVWGILVQG